MPETLIKQIERKLREEGLLPLRAQADLSTAILRERLEVVLPWAMEESGFDFWIVAARENCMDPVLKTLYPWDMLDVRRHGILAFQRDQKTGLIRKMVIGRGSPEMSRIYERMQEPDEDIWQAIGRVVRECNPDRIAINRSKIDGFCDGLSSTMYEQLQGALQEKADRLYDGEELALRWLQRVSPLEEETMKVLCELTHAIIRYSFSQEVIKIGETTTTDVEWFMRDVINRLGFSYWFGPDVNLQRQGSSNPLMINEMILPGDLIHCDIGLNSTYIQLHTDIQWMAYILKEGEVKVPEELQGLFVKGKRLQDIVREKMKHSPTGNAAFFTSMETAEAEGIRAMIYTHPIGTFGHGAGPSIGRYDLQGFVPVMGEREIRAQTCFALELNVADQIQAWNGQLVYMYLEENIYKDERVRFIAGRQEKLLLI